jgi:hypothetical protein
MTAQIGADGLDFFGDPRPELLTDVARIQPQPGDEWVDLEGRLGFRSTQRLRLSDLAGGVAVATWPAELARQARYLYGRGLGSALVAAAIERGWTVEPSPHLAYHTAPPGRRLYMRPSMAPLDYVARWEDEDALRRVGNHSREDVEHELWPWLKQRGLADDGDDTELRRFLDEFLGRRPAHMRPGLRFRRVWTFAEAAGLGSALADTIRSEIDGVFAVAHEPALSSAPIAGLEAREGGSARTASAHIDGFVREAAPERVRHEVWTDQQIAVLQAIYDYFHEHSTWPTFITIDRPIRRAHGWDTAAIVQSLPESVIVQPRHGNLRPVANDQLRLRLRGFLSVRDSTDDTERFVQLLRWLAGREMEYEPPAGSDDEMPQVTSQEAAQHLGLDAADRLSLQRLYAMLQLDHWGLGGSGSNEDGWYVRLGPDIWRFRNVQTIEDCVQAREDWLAEPSHYEALRQPLISQEPDDLPEPNQIRSCRPHTWI